TGPRASLASPPSPWCPPRQGHPMAPAPPPGWLWTCALVTRYPFLQALAPDRVECPADLAGYHGVGFRPQQTQLLWRPQGQAPRRDETEVSAEVEFERQLPEALPLLFRDAALLEGRATQFGGGADQPPTPLRVRPVDAQRLPPPDNRGAA